MRILLLIAIAALSYDSAWANSVKTVHTVEMINGETWVTTTASHKLEGPKADVLFVVDSGVYDYSTVNITGPILRLVERLSTFGDVNAAVISLALKKEDSSKLGHFVGPVLNSRVADFSSSLIKQIHYFPILNGEKQLLDLTSLALSKTLLDTVNTGFLRSDADLYIVFITAARDKSNISVSDLQAQLLKLKPNRQLYAYALMPRIPNYSVCPDTSHLAGMPKKLEDFLALNAGEVDELCFHVGGSVNEKMFFHDVPEIKFPLLPDYINTYIDAASLDVKLHGRSLEQGSSRGYWGGIRDVQLGWSVVPTVGDNDVVARYRMLYFKK